MSGHHSLEDGRCLSPKGVEGRYLVIVIDSVASDVFASFDVFGQHRLPLVARGLPAPGTDEPERKPTYQAKYGATREGRTLDRRYRIDRVQRIAHGPSHMSGLGTARL